MRVQFATKDNKVIYCDNEILRITHKNKDSEYKISDIGKVEIEKNIMYFYTMDGKCFDTANVAAKEHISKIDKIIKTINTKNVEIDENYKVKRKKSARLFWISAIVIGLVIGLLISQDNINRILTPNFRMADSNITLQLGWYKYWVVLNDDVKEKDIERIGKQMFIETKKQNVDVSSLMVFVYKNEEDFEKEKLYARANFEEEERYLISEKKGKYKGLYYTVDMEYDK